MTSLKIRLLLLLSFLATCSTNLASEKVKLTQVNIFGARNVSVAEIRKWLEVSPGDAVTRRELLHRRSNILRHLQDQGYYFARIDSLVTGFNADSSEIALSVYLAPGPAVNVAEYKIVGINVDKIGILRALELKEGKLFRPAFLQHDIEILIQHFEDHGYPYCRVELKELTWNETANGHSAGLKVTLEVLTGRKIVINEIEIRGNTHTRAATILRELPLNVGRLYQQKQIERIPNRLMNLGFFKWVNPPRLELLQDESGRLIIELAEGNHNRFDGIAGYNPATENNSGFITGLIDIKLGNLFGTGRKLAARWERRSRETQALQFSYTEPWVAGWPLDAGFRFQQLIQDTSYIEREVALSGRYRISESLRLMADVSRREISPDSAGIKFLGIQPSSSINFSAGISFSNLDHPLNPSRGVAYETSFKWAKKSSSARTDSSARVEIAAANQKHLTIDIESYFSLFSGHVFAVGLHGREVNSSAVATPLPDQYRFGGTQSLRGYREDQFRGERIAWANVEYRYLLGLRSRLFLFLDTGYFFRRDLAASGQITEIEKFKFGYGFGLRLDTRLGLVGIDYGLGEDDRFSNGKIHLRLINEF